MATGYVRPARPGEATEIARIQLATWRTAYRPLLPRKLIDELDEAWAARRWDEAIVTPPTPRHRVLVAVEQADPARLGTAADVDVVTAGEAGRATQQSARTTTEAAPAYLVGFAAIGPADEAALAPDETGITFGPEVAAVTEIMVEPRWGRRGHGSRLLAACVDLWRSDGFTTAVAWTFVEDRATRRFFEGAGWAPDGASRALDADDLLIPQVRLHTTIGNGEPAQDVIKA